MNAKVESFHGRLRDECLNVSWFANLWDARGKPGGQRNKRNGGKLSWLSNPPAFAATVAAEFAVFEYHLAESCLA